MSSEGPVGKEIRPSKKALARVARRADDYISGIARQNRESTALTPQAEVLEQEDDLAMLALNQKQYLGAIQYNQIYLNLLRMLDSWGIADSEREVFMKTISAKSTSDALVDTKQKYVAILRDKVKVQMIGAMVKSLARVPRIYEDELDVLIKEDPELAGGIPYADLVAEKLRTERETLALIRMQIDFLKEQGKKEREQKSAPKDAQIEVKPLVQDTVEAVQEEPKQVQAEIAPATPFGLVGWKVFWTDTKFSDNPNHLVQLPTSSKADFLAALEEINTGRKRFRIKTSSVASAMEMWDLKEFRDKVLVSRYRWGPEHVRQWGKIVRGGVRILVKNFEDEKKVIFSAVDRDEVYRHVFAGMSS